MNEEMYVGWDPSPSVPMPLNWWRNGNCLGSVSVSTEQLLVLDSLDLTESTSGSKSEWRMPATFLGEAITLVVNLHVCNLDRPFC